MKEIRIWDKKESINLNSAQSVLERVPFLVSSNKVLLVYEEGQEDYILEIAAIETVKANNGWGRKTDDEVIELYTEKLNTPVEPTPSHEEDILENLVVQMEGQADIYETLLTLLENQETIKANQENILIGLDTVNNKLDQLLNPETV